MKKQILLIIMILLPMVANADQSGKCGDNATWTYDESTRTLTISGSGRMMGVGPTGDPLWYDLRDEIQTVLICEGIINIYNSSFRDCTKLTSVTIPNSMTSIEYNAFQNCTSLTTIKIPDTVNSIGISAFYGCSSLTSINIPKNLSIINNHTFSGCSSLSSLEIPNSVLDIGYRAFYGCTNLVSIKIPSKLTSISEELFSGCASLENISIPNSVKEINARAFSGCSALSSITIPSNVTNIRGPIFEGCSSLKSVIVESGNQYYDSRDNCNAIIESKTNKLISGCNNTIIPNSVTEICSDALFNLSNLISVSIPSSVAKIGIRGFSDCINLTSIKVEAGNKVYDSRENCNAIIESRNNTLIIGCKATDIPNSVVTIGMDAFHNISDLSSIIIPQSVTNIDNNAFYGCRLENILTYNCKTYFTGGGFTGRTLQHAMLYIPEGKWSEAVYDGSWYLFNNIREITTEKNNISQSRAYMLMDTENFGYAVYDEVDDKVKMVNAFYSMDENDLNNNWQVRKQGSNSYLYNLGAKKFATIAADGRLILTADATPLSLTEGENGIIIDADGEHEWAFVKNNSLNDATAIDIPAITSDLMPEGYYSLDGQHLTKPHKGVNIIRTKDGKTKKIIKK